MDKKVMSHPVFQICFFNVQAQKKYHFRFFLNLQNNVLKNNGQSLRGVLFFFEKYFFEVDLICGQKLSRKYL
jgi:hypothetical protein